MSDDQFYLGIDPGIHGAAAVLSPGGTIVEVISLPLRLGSRGKEEVDAKALYDWLRSWDVALCALEAVHALPTDGRKSSFSFGVSVGKVRAALEVAGTPLVEPSPQAWKAAVLSGTDRSKDAAVAYAVRRWPKADLRERPNGKKLSHDKAEACCLSYFALLKAKGTVK